MLPPGTSSNREKCRRIIKAYFISIAEKPRDAMCRKYIVESKGQNVANPTVAPKPASSKVRGRCSAASSPRDEALPDDCGHPCHKAHPGMRPGAHGDDHGGWNSYHTGPSFAKLSPNLNGLRCGGMMVSL